MGHRAGGLAVAPLAVATVSLGLAGCGGVHRDHGARAQTPQQRRPTDSARPHRGFTRVAVRSIGTLPAAVQDAAIAPLEGRRLALLGGIDASGVSLASVTVIASGSTATGGALPVAQHDAQAARLGRDVYVFGGGVVSSYDHILRYDPATRRATSAGRLPTDASDVAVASVGNTAYVVGGYDGADWLDTIVAWRPGTAPRVVARLPSGLRYAAAAASGDHLLIVGGTTPSGVSDAILSFDPVTRSVSRIGRLPAPLTHAGAASIDGRVLVVGGRRTLDGDQTRAILSIDPITGRCRRAGSLDRPLSDAAVTATATDVVVAGGLSASGARNELLALTPRGVR